MTPTSTPKKDRPGTDPYADSRERSKDAIVHDPRRTPYGHHQWGRDRAIRTLDKMLAEAEPPRRAER